MLPLTRCRHCSSKLLQLERLWLLPMVGTWHGDGAPSARRSTTSPPRPRPCGRGAATRGVTAIASSSTMLELVEGVAELEPLKARVAG